MCLRWHHCGACADGRYKLWLTPHNRSAACLLQQPSKITPPSWTRWGREAGVVCYLPVSLMELNAHLLWVGCKFATMSPETMPFVTDYTADMTSQPTRGQTGARSVTACSHLPICLAVCRMYTHRCATVSFPCLALITQHAYLRGLMCQHILVSVYSTCVLGVGSLGFFFFKRGKTWVDGLLFPACRWIMTAAGRSAATGLLAWTRSVLYSSLHFMVRAMLTVYIYIYTAAGKSYSAGSRTFVLVRWLHSSLWSSCAVSSF